MLFAHTFKTVNELSKTIQNRDKSNTVHPENKVLKPFVMGLRFFMPEILILSLILRHAEDNVLLVSR